MVVVMMVTTVLLLVLVMVIMLVLALWLQRVHPEIRRQMCAPNSAHAAAHHHPPRLRLLRASAV